MYDRAWVRQEGNLIKVIISVTETQSYMRCRQQWDWSSYNREAYQPVVAKPALAIGRLWHQTQAEWSLNPDADPNSLVLTLANVELDRVRTDYLALVGAPMSPIELEPVYDQMGLVIAMVNNYYKRWGTPLPDGFQMVAPEQTCVVPIPNTKHECECFLENSYGTYRPDCTQCQGTGDAPHYLEGTLDGLIKDKYGRVYVLERKTYGQRPKIEILNMQDQFLAYLWILRELGMGEVGGLAYDGAWKRKEPPRNSALEDLFLRTLLHRNKSELDRFAVQLAARVNEMANDPSIYINRRWDGCWDCQFVEPCISQERGEDYKYMLNTRFIKRPPSEDSTRELKYGLVADA